MNDLLDQIRAGIDRIGWSKTSRLTGIDRITLYRHYGPSRRTCPRLDEILKVNAIVGLELKITEKHLW